MREMRMRTLALTLLGAPLLLALTGCPSGGSTAPHIEANDKGNGGIAVTCTTSQGTTTELLDYYEARVLRAIGHDFSDAAAGVEGRLALAFSRLERLDRNRAAAYREQAMAFFSQVRFVREALIPDTNDYGHVPLPASCRFEQIASQRRPRFAEDRRYLISQELWDRLDDDNRAGLILHEIVYREALSKGQRDSIGARYFTSVVTAKQIETLDDAGYALLLAAAGLTVTSGNHEPRWLFDTLQLSSCINKPFSTDLSRYARDADDDTLVFATQSMFPGFLLSPQGTLTGTAPSIGTFTAPIRVSDGKAVATTQLVMLVTECKLKTEPEFEALEGKTFSVALKPLFEDFGPFTAKKIAGASWLDVTADGTLFGTPSYADYGTNRIAVRLYLANNAVHTFRAYVTVARRPRAPIWVRKELRLRGLEGDTTRMSVSTAAFSPDDKPLSYSLKFGPPWVSVTPNGVLETRFPVGKRGQYLAIVTAHDGILSSDVAVRIFVLPSIALQ